MKGLNRDGVARADLTPSRHDRHDAGFQCDLSIRPATERRRHQSLLKPIELHTRVSQAGNLDFCIIP